MVRGRQLVRSRQWSSQERQRSLRGGASGLGAATVAALVRADCQVFVFDLPGSGEAGQRHDGVQYLDVDVTDVDQVRIGLDVVSSGQKPLRTAINCAGVAPSARILSRTGVHDLHSFRRAVEINLVGTFNVLSQAAAHMAALPELADGGRGVIINTASVAAYEGQIGQAAYASSKAGIVGLTLPAARDLASFGIRVNSIAPGILETSMLAAVDDKFKRALIHGVPFPKRLGRPVEYARLALFLIENDYINGETVRLDGALRMGPK